MMDAATKFVFTPIVKTRKDHDHGWSISSSSRHRHDTCPPNIICFSTSSNVGPLLLIPAAIFSFLIKMCHPVDRRIDVTQQSQNGDGNGDSDLNNQSDWQQINHKIGTFYLCIKPKKKVRVAACDRRLRMLEKVTKAETLETFLDALGLGKYSLIFRSEDYDMRTLEDVDEANLVYLAIPAGPGRRILQALKLKLKYEA